MKFFGLKSNRHAPELLVVAGWIALFVFLQPCEDACFQPCYAGLVLPFGSMHLSERHRLLKP